MKYALVTGGSRGIGRAIGLELAAMGYYVLVNYLSNAEEAERTLAEIRSTAETESYCRSMSGIRTRCSSS